MNKRLIELIEELFRMRLSAKSSWSVKDLMYEYNCAVTSATLTLLEELGDYVVAE